MATHFPSISTWHLELSSRCALACPKCPRSHLSAEDFTFLDYKRFEEFFLATLKEGHHWNLVNLCGNHGDPIYHPRLFDFIKLFKANNVVVELTTNGSHRNQKWWSELMGLLSERDSVIFSVDGLRDTLALYRVGADWASVEEAMEVVAASRVKSIWKFIAFRHNQAQIEEAQALARTLDINEFILVKSSAWETVLDPMLPDWEYIEESKRRELEIELRDLQALRPQTSVGPHNRQIKPASLNEVSDRLKKRSQEVNKVYPRCYSEHHYISASGYYSPCCWMSVAHFNQENPFRSAEFHYPKSFNSVQKAVENKKLLSRIELAEFTACRVHCKHPCDQYHGHEFQNIEVSK